MHRRARGVCIAGVLALALVAPACGTGSSKASPANPTTPGSGTRAADVPGVGTGVTDSEIKLGVTLIDYKCIPASVLDSIYVNQPQAYNAYIDDMNEHGGINGRKVVPTYKYICPLQPAAAVSACTSLTDDSKVFAVIGSMYDPNGDAQLCVPQQHNTVLITDGL